MNIDWSESPYWANWAAMDGNGEWWWHELEPCFYEEGWEWQSMGKIARINQSMDTLVQRPIKD